MIIILLIITVIITIIATITATITPFIFATITILKLLQSNGSNYNDIYGIMDCGRKRSGKYIANAMTALIS